MTVPRVRDSGLGLTVNIYHNLQNNLGIVLRKTISNKVKQTAIMYLVSVSTQEVLALETDELYTMSVRRRINEENIQSQNIYK